MLAQRSIGELVDEIHILYSALRKTNYSAKEIARTINDVLLQKGISKDTISEAWDEWISKHEAIKGEQ